MSDGKGGKSASVGASACLRRRVQRTSGVTSRTVPSDATSRTAVDTSPSDNFLSTRDRRHVWATC